MMRWLCRTILALLLAAMPFSLRALEPGDVEDSAASVPEANAGQVPDAEAVAETMPLRAARNQVTRRCR